MAKVTNRLTAVEVRNLKAEGLHPDGAGLYLKVTGGSKSWVLRYMLSGRARYLGLGPASNVTLGKARELADEARTLIRQGIDPIEHRKQERSKVKLAEATELTFRQCAEALIESHEPSWRNRKHRQQWRNTLATYVYPVLGNHPVGSVDTALVLKVLQQPVVIRPDQTQPLWFARPETAGRIRGRVESVLSWAKAKGLRDGENPAQWRGHLDQLLPARGKVRRVEHHPALPYSDIPEFMAGLRERNGISARALEFVILTASRTGEALGARFEEFDLDACLWVVPADRMKGAREHRVALSRPAVATVKNLAELRLSEQLVFPGMKPGRSLSDMALLMLLRDLRPGITTHGFRSTFKDWASEMTSFPDFVSEAALAHVSADKVRAAYARSDLFEKRRQLMEAWGRFCTTPPSEKIVPFNRREV